MNHINLSLPVLPLNNIISVMPTDPNKNEHWLVTKEMMSSSFITFLNQLDLDVGPSNVLFYTPPFGHLGIHIDGARQHDNCMLNFVWGSDNHKMFWYTMNPTFAVEVKTFTNNDNYISVPEEVVTKIDETIVGHPTIVKVGIPHSVKNYSTTGRWCLSIDLKYIGSNESFPGINFNEAAEIFKPYARD